MIQQEVLRSRQLVGEMLLGVNDEDDNEEESSYSTEPKAPILYRDPTTKAVREAFPDLLHHPDSLRNKPSKKSQQKVAGESYTTIILILILKID